MNVQPALANRPLYSADPAKPKPEQAPAEPKDTFSAAPVAVGGTVGAVLLGGSAALGALYNDPGIAGAAALAGLTGGVLGLLVDDQDPGGLVLGGIAGAVVSAGVALLGEAIGPGFSIAAGVVGGGLGATIGYISSRH